MGKASVIRVKFSGKVHPDLGTQAIIHALLAQKFGERNLLPISDPEYWEPLTAASLWARQLKVSVN
jgi:hypothetical protein